MLSIRVKGRQPFEDKLMSERREIEAKPDKPGNNTADALRDEARSALEPRVKVIGDRAELLDTKTVSPKGKRVGPSDPEAEITVTVMVKSKASEQEIDSTLQKIAEGKQRPLNDKEFKDKFGADPAALAKVKDFAKDNGLKTDKADEVSGQVLLKGKVKDFCKAFDVKLDDYQNGPIVSRERSGNISVPKGMADDVKGVFGLENSTLATPHFKKSNTTPRDNSSFMPQEVADLYKFPKESMGGGQSVGIIELGGGLDLQDNSKYYKDHGLKEPKIQLAGVDGAQSTTGSDADGEVALDTQIIGAIAPDAAQQLIFAPNSDQGFIDAITRATFPEKGEIQNSAISISWGAAENNWTRQAADNMNAAFKKAALKGVSVFAASGDDGSTDGSSDKKHYADYPSSDPYVTGTGGTKLEHNGKEVTWNDGAFGGATGGGLSGLFPVPEFQKAIKLPANANKHGKPGRGDPDIAGDASPTTGYTVRYGGSESVVGGTSAVAPLYAGLMMRVNGALGHPVGYLNPFLYQNGKSGIYKDITEGNNGGYKAGPGWDAATGWGSINGEKFLELLKKQGK